MSDTTQQKKTTHTKQDSVATRIIIRDRLIHKAASLNLYAIVISYAKDIIEDIECLNIEIDKINQR